VISCYLTGGGALVGSSDNFERFGNWLERVALTEQFKVIEQEYSSSPDLVISFYSGQGLFSERLTLPRTPFFEEKVGSLPLRFCIESITNGLKRSFISKRTLVFRCFCGAGYLAVPIVIDGCSVGCLLCGQFLFKRYKEDELNLSLGQLNLSFDEYKRLIDHFASIPVVGKEFIRITCNRLDQMASFIIKMYHKDVLETRNSPGEKRSSKKDMFFERGLKYFQAKDLRGQLNPHFLFNTLNAISQLAMLEGAGQTQELTYQLSEYLRYVLSKQSKHEIVTLSMEMECIERYLEIHKVRFGERLSFRIAVSKGAEKAEIPFMLLQPIVENAVFHGIEPSLRQGIITIFAKIIGPSVLIEIKDNGVGCDPERIKQGIGLQNVRNRMSLHYGSSSDLVIKSEPAEGTSVLIRVPFEGV